MKSLTEKYYVNLFLNNRLFLLIGINICLFFLGFFFEWLGLIPFVFLGLILVLLLVDILQLYKKGLAIYGERQVGNRLSNGDDNPVVIKLINDYPIPLNVRVIDEVPVQFQLRDKYFYTRMEPGQSANINYSLRPVKRGAYSFGRLRVYVQSSLGLISRRFNLGSAVTLPVFPSFLKLRQYELMAISNTLFDYGAKKIRRVGHSLEFDQVKTYVGGDDIRTINWKATARKGDLMVNAFIDERSQQIYSVIDKSRAMRMPFENLSLLDYAINAAVALSKVALLKEDKAGLITISDEMGTMIKADRRAGQLTTLMHALYNEKTRYLETNMEALFTAVRAQLNQRSLLVFYTNFESMSAMHRQLPVLKQLSKYHLLLVVFFENTTLKEMSTARATNIEEIYKKTIADKFVYEKKMIVKELMQHGILSLLTTPQNLTINVINKYLALKAQQKI